jgi:Tfp pilus assembly protein PilZ
MRDAMADERIQTALQTRFEAGPVKASGEIGNVGQGGLFVATPSIPETGEKVELRFEEPGGQRVEVAGVVWWTTDCQEVPGGQPPGFGVRLVNAGETYRELLRQLRRAPVTAASPARRGA